jgi:hypothetical protein
VQRLIDAGANVNTKHTAGPSALHQLVSVSAAMGSSGQKIRSGKIYFAGQWGATGHQRVAEVLLQAGADVNGTNALGQTALHLAALTGHSEASRYLLAKGGDVNAADDKGRTPLQIARWSMPGHTPHRGSLLARFPLLVLLTQYLQARRNAGSFVVVQILVERGFL